MVAAHLRSTHWRAIIITVALLFHLCGAAWVMATVPFPSAIDEAQHVSYIIKMGEAPTLFPRFDQLFVVDPTLSQATDAPNYLPHPSPYYHMMSWIDDPASPVERRISAWRIANAVLSTIGVAFMLLAGMRLLLAPTSFALYAAMVVMFPKLAVVGGMINNDNLGVLATGIAIFGLARWQGTTDRCAAALMALGMALAGWTKLTVLLMVGIAFVAAEALRLWRERAWPNMRDAAIIVAGGAIAAIPTFQNLLTYGRPLFISPTANFVDPAERPAIGFAHYAVHFLRAMWLKWSAFEPMQLVQGPSLVATLAAAAFVLARLVRTMQCPTAIEVDPEANRIAAAYVISTVLTLALHIFFGWQAFQAIGDMAHPQPRYYYGVWPGLALTAAIAVMALPAGRWRGYSTILLLVTSLSTTVQFVALLIAARL